MSRMRIGHIQRPTPEQVREKLRLAALLNDEKTVAVVEVIRPITDAERAYLAEQRRKAEAEQEPLPGQRHADRRARRRSQPGGSMRPRRRTAAKHNGAPNVP